MVRIPHEEMEALLETAYQRAIDRLQVVARHNGGRIPDTVDNRGYFRQLQAAVSQGYASLPDLPQGLRTAIRRTAWTAALGLGGYIGYMLGTNSDPAGLVPFSSAVGGSQAMALAAGVSGTLVPVAQASLGLLGLTFDSPSSREVRDWAARQYYQRIHEPLARRFNSYGPSRLLDSPYDNSLARQNLTLQALPDHRSELMSFDQPLDILPGEGIPLPGPATPSEQIPYEYSSHPGGM